MPCVVLTLPFDTITISMANYKGHTVGGLVAATVVVVVYYILTWGHFPDSVVLISDWQLLAGLYVVSVLFAIFPDIDTNSKAQNLFYAIAFVSDVILIIYSYFAAAAILGLLAMTPIVGKHRGWTHSRWAVLVIPLPIIVVPYLSSQAVGQSGLLIYGAAVAGYFSHLLLDGLIWKRFRVKGGW